MTITQNSNYVLSHPFTKVAVQKYLSGDIKDFKFLIDLLQIDIYQEVAISCTKAFKRYKGENYPLTESAIRDVEPPERLNIKLPIPIPQPECKVVPMPLKRVTKPKIVTQMIITSQLLIPFPQKTPSEILIAL